MLVDAYKDIVAGGEMAESPDASDNIHHRRTVITRLEDLVPSDENEVEEYCRNPGCEHAKTCRKSPSRDEVQESVKNIERAKGIIPTQYTFSIRDEGIADLKIIGELNSSLNACLAEIDDAMAETRGFFLRVYSNGSLGTFPERLEERILTAAQNGPTVGWFNLACSGAVLPLLSCRKNGLVFASPTATFGGLGVGVFGCLDGVEPFFLSSSVTTQKEWERTTPNSFTRLRSSPQILERIQAQCDHDFARDLRAICQYINRTFDDLPEVLISGGHLEGDILRRLGIVDSFSTPDVALQCLTRMVKQA